MLDVAGGVGDELVLNYVVERKRMDDLASSITDGRFREQKVGDGHEASYSENKRCIFQFMTSMLRQHGYRHLLFMGFPPFLQA